jgi:magnesium chelatase subunit I
MVSGRLPVTLPIGATDDRVLGGWQVESLMNSTAEWQPGLIEEAGTGPEAGILYIDEVNLLDDHLVNIILDVASTGILTVQREGAAKEPVSVRFNLVGTMNPEEGNLRPQLLDRFGLVVSVESAQSSAERRQILNTVLEFEWTLESGTSRFIDDGYQQDLTIQARLDSARKRLSSVAVPDEMLAASAAISAAFRIEGHRGELVTVRAARALAAIEGDTIVGPTHLATVAPLALVHRRAVGDSGALRRWSAEDEAVLAEHLPQPDAT